MTYAFFFGFFSGEYVDLTPVIASDLVGIGRVSNALGIVYLFQDVATAIGTPIVGKKRKKKFSCDDVVLHLGIILFAISILKQRQEHHQGLTKHQRDMVVVSYSKQISTADE
ncbi:unnamed protein product [Rotaria sp. Silwood2]|nr:unnamed protein product [Rotaria sp. Silwood2]